MGLLALTGKAAARFEKALISLSLLTEESRKPSRINRDDLQLSFTQNIICGQLPVYYNGESHLLAANEIFTQWSSIPAGRDSQYDRLTTLIITLGVQWV